MFPLLPLGHFTYGYEMLGFEKGEMFVSACSIYIIYIILLLLMLIFCALLPVATTFA
jgi:hypothetical protein